MNVSTIAHTSMEDFTELAAEEHVLVGIYLIVIGILSSILNALVVYTCFRHWRTLTNCDYYIFSLACGDLLLTLSSFFLPIVSSLYNLWIFGNIGCAFQGFLGFFFAVSSVFTLTVMGVVRYISICHPNIDISKQRYTIITIVFPYVYAFIWASCPLVGLGVYSLESYGTSCSLQGNSRYFATIVAVCCVYTPLLIILFSYGSIVFKYKSSSQKVQKSIHKNRKGTRREAFLFKITFIMCCSSLITWVPYAVVSMWPTYGKLGSFYVRFSLVASLLSKTATVINPLIYFIMSKKLRPLLVRSISVHRSRTSTLTCYSQRQKTSPLLLRKYHLTVLKQSQCSSSPIVHKVDSGLTYFVTVKNNCYPNIQSNGSCVPKKGDARGHQCCTVNGSVPQFLSCLLYKDVI